MNRQVNRFAQMCSEEFTENLVCILQHGSTVTGNSDAQSDFDIIVIFAAKKIDDLAKLNTILKQAFDVENVKVDLQIFYLSELPLNADYFSLFTNGAFFVWCLRKARVVYGKNIFLDMDGPSIFQLRLSLFQKVQQYIYFMRQTVTCRDDSPERIRYLQKRMFMAMKDILMWDGVVYETSKEILARFKERFGNVFKEKEWLEIERLTDDSITELALAEIAEIYERFYEIILTKAKADLGVCYLLPDRD